MEKKNIYAVLVLVILAGLAVYSMRTPDSSERVGERPRALPALVAANIASLELAQPGGTDKVTLTKKAEKWQVTAPVDKPADQQAVKTAVEALEKLKWGDITTQQKDRHADLEVSDDKAVHVVAKDASGAVLADLLVGKSVGTWTLVRVAGKDDVWQAGELYASTFKREGKSWRDHVIFDLKADEAEKVVLATVDPKDGSLELERVLPAAPEKKEEQKPASIHEAKWKVSKGQIATLKAGVELDHAVVNRLVQSVATLRAGDFLDAGKPDELGLAPGAPGQIEITVTFKGGQTAAVRLGSQKGEDLFAMAVASSQIFSLKKWGVEQLLHIPADLGDKSVLSLKADQIESATIVQGTESLILKPADKSWKADKLPDADEAKLKGIAEGFDGLVGTGFVPASAPEQASLVKPRGLLTLKPKGQPPVVLKIGDARGEDVVVQKIGMLPVWMKKYQVDRFFKKPADVAKDKK